MQKTFFRMTMGLGLLALGALQVSGQTSRNCAPRPVVIERLAGSYGETRKSTGLGTNNSLIEVFASEDTGSWTITMTSPNGTTCLLAAGNAFETVVDVTPAGDPA